MNFMEDRLLVSLDLETKCAVASCTDNQCQHGLTPHLATVTVVGLYWEVSGKPYTYVTRDLRQLATKLAKLEPYTLVGARLKFDLRMLHHHGLPIPVERYHHDVSLMGVASYEKVPAQWLAEYEGQRKLENKKVKRGFSHRKGTRHSLKTMAPYFLGVKPFWEDPSDHDDDAYVLKDCEYTYRLVKPLLAKLKAQGTLPLYTERLMPWARMFLRAELRGIKLDMRAVKQGSIEAEEQAARAKKELDAAWKKAYRAYKEEQRNEVGQRYFAMEQQAVARARNAFEARPRLAERYGQLQQAALAKVEPFSLTSPSQLKWLLRDHLVLDICKLDGSESTDAEVLERLAAEGRTDVAALLKYREATKLVTTYFPSYRELSHKGVLHSSFNLSVTKTGRTSSSTPNLQNQPSALHRIFIARPGYKIITKDLSAIEPTWIAYYTEDEKLIRLIQSDQKFHSYNAVAIFQENWDVLTLKKDHPAEYDMAKEIGLAVLYGAGGERVRGCALKRGYRWSESRCKKAVWDLRGMWQGVARFKRELDELARTKPIWSYFGRARSFVDCHEDIYMQAFNSLIQGTGSDLLLDGSHKAEAEYIAKGIDASPVLWVHDEALVEVADSDVEEADEILTRCLTNYDLATPFGPVPLRVEGKISDRWEK